MGRFINPFTDVGFKRIFGQEINKDLLIDFLNALLEGEKKIKDITFLDKELLPEFEKDRSVIYDVYCTDESDEQFIVEMQNGSTSISGNGRYTTSPVPSPGRGKKARSGCLTSRRCTEYSS